MPFSSVVLLQSDPVLTQSLMSSLCNSFRSVHIAPSLDDLRSSVAKHRADVAIVDIERASISDVHRLSSEFPGVGIVCTHRLAEALQRISGSGYCVHASARGRRDVD